MKTLSLSSVSISSVYRMSRAARVARRITVSLAVGATRGTSAVVYPRTTTTYILYATNQYGRTTAQVIVPVP